MSGNAGSLTGFLNSKPFAFSVSVVSSDLTTITGTVPGLHTNDIVVITGCSNVNIVPSGYMTASLNTVTGIVNLLAAVSEIVTFTGFMLRPEEIPLTNNVVC